MKQEQIFQWIRRNKRMNKYKFLYKIKCILYGEDYAKLQDDILDRYDNEEYWNKDLI